MATSEKIRSQDPRNYTPVRWPELTKQMIGVGAGAPQPGGAYIELIPTQAQDPEKLAADAAEQAKWNRHAPFQSSAGVPANIPAPAKQA